MDQILEECQGCIRIADDITVHSCTEVEHDANLWNLMQVACKYGLVFNPQKTHIKGPALNFFSYLYNTDSVHLDLDKVNAVHALPVPTNVTKLQEFLGMVTYLSPFILGLSTLIASLHELLKKDTGFTWNCIYDATFQLVKDAVISNTPLRYFDPSLPVTIQVNASQEGLGAELLQNNNLLLLAAKPSLKLNATTPTLKERCSLSSSEQRDSELTPVVDSLPLSQTTNPWIPSPRRT